MKDNMPSQERMDVAGNGIPIYHYANPHLHSFCIVLYVKAGPLYETDDTNGTTHLWEHTLFRKINTLLEGDFYTNLDTLGLSFSAATYTEYVRVKVTGAVGLFAKAAEIISLVFEPVQLSSRELNLEKKRIKAEIHENSYQSSLGYFTDQIVWQGTPLRNTILGKCKVLDKIGVRALLAIEGSILSEGNLFFYVTGAFEQKDIGYLAKCVGGYSLGKAPRRQSVAPVPEAFFHRNGHVAVKNSEYHYVRFTFDIDMTRYTFAEIYLLSNILFSGDMSKVYQELSEKTGYIYSFDNWLEQYRNIASLSVEFETQKKNLFPTIEAVINILQQMKQSITNELSLVLPRYTTNAEMLLDDDEELNWDMGYCCHILGESYSNINQRREGYEAVTPERIMEIAMEIFVPNNTVLTLKTHKKSFDTERAHSLLMTLSN